MDKKVVNVGWTTAYGDSDTVEIEQPVTSWMSCGEFENARGTFELRGLSNTDLEFRLVLQFADFPDQATYTIKVLEAFQSSEGFHYPNVWTDIVAEAKANQVVRIAVAGKRKTGAGLACARIAGRVELKSC